MPTASALAASINGTIYLSRDESGTDDDNSSTYFAIDAILLIYTRLIDFFYKFQTIR
jgi:hypothetical protein